MAGKINTLEGIEPATPSASYGSTYIDSADGYLKHKDDAGAVTFLSRRNGFIDYNDGATAGTPITLVANTWTDITNDGAGSFGNSSYKPSGVTDLLDTATGYFDLTELAFGTVVFIRNDFTVTPTLANQILEMRYSLGTGGSAYTLEKLIGRLDTGGGTPVPLALSADMLYVGDANTRDNPVKLQVRLTGAGTVVNQGSVINVHYQ